MGCGRKECDGKGGTPGWYVVCEYYPPGNVIGFFKENVQSQVTGLKNGDSQGVVGKASGSMTRGDTWYVGALVGCVALVLL